MNDEVIFDGLLLLIVFIWINVCVKGWGVMGIFWLVSLSWMLELYMWCTVWIALSCIFWIFGLCYKSEAKCWIFWYSYKRNGILPMLKRNSGVKLAPQRWQDNAVDGFFDIVFTFEEKVFDMVIEGWYVPFFFWFPFASWFLCYNRMHKIVCLNELLVSILAICFLDC